MLGPFAWPPVQSFRDAPRRTVPIRIEQSGVRGGIVKYYLTDLRAPERVHLARPKAHRIRVGDPREAYHPSSTRETPRWQEWNRCGS